MALERIVKRFYDELDNGKMMGRKCTRCGAVEFPPVLCCNTCSCMDMEWHEISGNAEVTSCFLPAMMSTLPQNEVFQPYAIGAVKLCDIGFGGLPSHASVFADAYHTAARQLDKHGAVGEGIIVIVLAIGAVNIGTRASLKSHGGHLHRSLTGHGAQHHRGRVRRIEEGRDTRITTPILAAGGAEAILHVANIVVVLRLTVSKFTKGTLGELLTTENSGSAVKACFAHRIG